MFHLSSTFSASTDSAEQQHLAIFHTAVNDSGFGEEFLLDDELPLDLDVIEPSVANVLELHGFFSNNSNANEETAANGATMATTTTTPTAPVNNNTVPHTAKKTMSKRAMVERPRECVVCGRAANCCHFGIPSCLGCRSFFRRSVLAQREYFCHRKRECQIDQGELCRACRFDRCIMAGMDVNAINVGPDKLAQLQAVLTANVEKRKQQLLGKRRQQNPASSSTDQCEQKRYWMNAKRAVAAISALPSTTITQPNNDHLLLLDTLSYTDNKLLRIRHTGEDIAAQLGMFQHMDLFDVCQRELSHNLLARADQFSEQKNMPMALDYFVRAAASDQLWYVRQPDWLFIDSLLCVELAKTLPVMRQLSLEDQTLLLCSNVLPTVLFTQCFYSRSVNNADEVLAYPSGFSPLCLRRNATTLRLFHEHMFPFKRIGMDRNEFLLLRNIVLLQPASADLSANGCNCLQSELENHSKALMGYERRKLGELAGAQRFAELLYFVKTVFQVGAEHRNFLIFCITLHRRSIDIRHHSKNPARHFQCFMDNIILGTAGKKVRGALTAQ